jgi:phage tail sheath protein FI
MVQPDIELNVTDTTTSPVKIEFPTTGKKPALNSFLYYSIQMFFQNGGGPCYIVSVGLDTAPADHVALNTGLVKLEAFDEPTLLIIPDTSILTDDVQAITLMNDILDQCAKLQDRFGVFDVRKDPATFRGTINGDIDKAKYGAAYYPDLNSLLNYNFSDDKVKVLTSSGKTLTQLKTSDNDLYNKIWAALDAVYITVPPSGAVAGIYAATDSNRGVWKAPANVTVTGIRGPSIVITDQDQMDLNVDTVAGKSINAIRTFTGKGTLVWGARTLAGNDNEWRYVPVRRLFIMIEESVKNASARFVFEPNDANTWTKVRAMIENYLTVLWRDGALAGAKPDQAFYVKVGLGQTMSAQDILDGKMIVEIGLAAVRPAEFIILRFMHKMQES